MIQREKEIELLAPAGSYETFCAVLRAGADAVYLGGSQFGARAYADNFTENELLAAIDYAHIHGRSVYLTVNTLFKEEELEKRLYDYLRPYYEHGLDAVIVQDMGALSLIRREFPDMEIHTSTQMTVTGAEGAAYMKSLGASRVVTARELSLSEIRRIHEETGVELESFVHGALCYCYSGQCLLSSMLGGRSGNRGRCAQPCRLPYEVYDAAGKKCGVQGEFVLSPKDLCTIDMIPQLSENGVYSFKIEGRMKQAEYAAGVVSVYRSYIDRYLKKLSGARSAACSESEARAIAAADYRVSKEDRAKLLDFGNRSGFTDGYYLRRNGREMITFVKPGLAKSNDALWDAVKERYVRVRPEDEIKEKINGILRLKKDSSATIELSHGGVQIVKTGDTVQEARKQPLSREKVEACMKKTGNTPFAFEKLEIEMDEGIFLPVQSLNALRREALDALEEALLAGYRRTAQVVSEDVTRADVCGKTVVRAKERGVLEAGAAAEDSPRNNLAVSTENLAVSTENFAVSTENRALRDCILGKPFVDDIYYDSSCYGKQFWEELTEDVTAAHRAGKKAYYILPAVFRGQTADFYREHGSELLAAGIDGVVAKSFDAAAFTREQLGQDVPMILDHSLYIWNKEAKKLLWELAPLRDTAPLELNRGELFGRDNRGSEIVIYGYLPLMTSAQCVHANTGMCDKRRTVTYLKDRYGKYFPVKNNCASCYNTIYNTTPLMLFDSRADFGRMGMAGWRVAFTIEDEKTAEEVLFSCEESFFLGRRKAKEVFAREYTNGHYKRGVE